MCLLFEFFLLRPLLENRFIRSNFHAYKQVQTTFGYCKNETIKHYLRISKLLFEESYLFHIVWVKRCSFDEIFVRRVNIVDR